MPEKKQLVEIEGNKLHLTNLEKILFPDAKIVKAEIIQYNLMIAPYLLKFGKDRPLSLIRFPDGIKAHQFYSKNAPDWRPDWIKTMRLENDDIDYMVLQSSADLIWLANLAALEVHSMNKYYRGELWMDHIVFDFDPPEAFSYEVLRDLTIEIGMFLRDLGLNPYVKTSGSRGAHIYIPIIPTQAFEEVITSIKLLAKAISQKFPTRTTNYFRKDKRQGKILIDINRNFEAQTTILPYSTRARNGAPVSMPLFWEDFGMTLSSGDYNIRNALHYLETKGNAWEDFYDNQVDFLEKVDAILGLKPKSEERKNKQESGGTQEKLFNRSQAQKDRVSQEIPSKFIAQNGQIDWYEKPAYKHMLAGVSKSMLVGENLVYENKWDGIRVFIYVHKGACKILSRSGRDISSSFPIILQAGKQAKEISCVLDGELVVQDRAGRPDFSRIISRMHSKNDLDKQLKQHPVSVFIFDVVRIGDEEVTNKPWQERREILKALLAYLPSYKLSEAIEEGELLYEAALKMDLEGIMIKNIHAIYEEGKRTSAWLKVKFNLEADCVILGYTRGEGDRAEYFGSLHVAEISEETLNYRGRVGTGFDQVLLEEMMNLFEKIPKGLKHLEIKTEEEKNSVWFSGYFPMCEIQFARLTNNETFREPVFKKLIDRIYEV